MQKRDDIPDCRRLVTGEERAYRAACSPITTTEHSHVTPLVAISSVAAEVSLPITWPSGILRLSHVHCSCTAGVTCRPRGAGALDQWDATIGEEGHDRVFSDSSSSRPADVFIVVCTLQGNRYKMQFFKKQKIDKAGKLGVRLQKWLIFMAVSAPSTATRWPLQPLTSRRFATA